MPQAPSTRWYPTPEQLMILEEMYRSGIRTPNALQIQQITAHLSYYGKIEGKNVFYWFQNHKARDRQKLRRRLSRQHQLLHLKPAATDATFTGGSADGSSSSVLQLYGLNGFEESTSSFPSPTYVSYPSPTHLFHQTGGAMNLLSKLDANVHEAEATAASRISAAYVHEWIAMTGGGDASSSSAIPPCSKSVKTLDLFPTISSGAGLKDECSTSNSSSSISKTPAN